MPAPKIVKLPYNWWTDREGHSIVAIIAHSTVGTDSRNYLSRGGNRADGSDRKVSIHVLIQKDGTIYRYVPDERAANHAGYGTLTLNGSTYHQGGVNLNQVTLGFELENRDDGKDPYTEAQLMAMGWQILQWRTAYGHLPIYRHAQVDPPPRKYDTRALSVAEIEQWVARANGSEYAPGVYRFPPLAVYERADLTGKVATYLPADSIVTIDATTGPGYAESAGHVADGSGFVDLRKMVKA